MGKKKSLHYELYGSPNGGGKKGYWRWAIGREKKPLLVGSFYGTFARCKRTCRSSNLASESTYSKIQNVCLKIVHDRLAVQSPSPLCPQSGHWTVSMKCPLSAKSRHRAEPRHLIGFRIDRREAVFLIHSRTSEKCWHGSIQLNARPV